MRKRLFCLLPLIALALGTPARCAFPASDPASGQADTSGTGQPGDISPNAPPSDWTPPYELLPGQYQDLENNARTDGTSPLPTFEMRSTPDTPADSTEIDPVTGAQLAPRVDVAGPGTPKWKVITYVSQRTTVDDNVYISHSLKQSDVFLSVAPGFAAGWGDFRSAMLAHSDRFSDQYGQAREPVSDPLDGDFLYANYTATATHFLSHDSLDGVDQDGSIAAQWAFTKLVLGLNARVQKLFSPDIDVGTLTRRTLLSLAATATYTLSDRTSFELDADGSIQDYVTELSSSDWHAQTFADYQLFPKTSIGAGLTWGVRTLQTTPDQYYEQGLLRAAYTPSGKLSLRVNGGIEIDEASGSTRLTPIFGIGATYAISDTDSATLDASRSTSSSAVTTGETNVSTGVNIGLRHRIYQNYSIECAVGYNHTEYYVSGLSTLVRTDNYLFLKPSLDYNFAQWSQIELAYEFHRNLSTQQIYDFGQNLAILQFNFVF
jgi:hypothetical protein